jgi:DNA polymerase
MDRTRSRRYLEAMGIQVWELRKADAISEPQSIRPEDRAAAVESQPGPVVPDPVSGADVSRLGWDQLAQRVAACDACGLEKTRTQTVFGVGDREADWMIVGEAPGADEDRQGEPFVGRAGQLLNAMLRAIGLQRSQVFIANILKCRPPGNRDPRPDEVAHCEGFLFRQIELVQPRVILAVGRISAQNLLKSTEPVGRLRGRVHRLGEAGIPLVVTYHPAYLLRSPDQKANAWKDLQLALSVTRKQ